MRSFAKASLLLLMATSAFTEQIQEQVSINVGHVFVPKGFDSNDNVEIIITGELPNTCYLRPHGEVKFINGHLVVDMKATKISGDDVVCIMAIVPYVASVPLGQLAAARYEIIINAGSPSQKISAIYVDRPTSESRNNFAYANVTKIENSAIEDEFVIEGYHPSSCMDIDRVEIIANDDADTYAILPLIKQTDVICDRRIKPFTYKVQIPPAKKVKLLHVRKIDGTAINHLVQNGINH